MGSSDNWAKELRELYSTLPEGPERFLWPGNLIPSLSMNGDPTMAAVRCVGNHNKDKKPAFPRMHNKFLVFCKASYRRETPPVGDDGEIEEYEYPVFSIDPYLVWTGSFNFTKNAAYSLENAVAIRDRVIVGAYYNEWEYIEAMSEPLDWESIWAAPEWRIGT